MSTPETESLLPENLRTRGGILSASIVRNGQRVLFWEWFGIVLVLLSPSMFTTVLSLADRECYYPPNRSPVCKSSHPPLQWICAILLVAFHAAYIVAVAMPRFAGPLLEQRAMVKVVVYLTPAVLLLTFWSAWLVGMLLKD
ncbi:hypothetical protein BC830DRAFT_1094137, partial [Chytriomyces sp. MP71]